MVDTVLSICYNKRVMENNTLPQFDRDNDHGLYACGASDFFNIHKRMPHWYPDGSDFPETNLTPAEIAEYMAGYQDSEELGYHKEW